MFVYEKPDQKQMPKKAIQKKEAKKIVSPPNLTGIPDGLKMRFENMSGFSFDDVRVHYNSDKPAQLQALAYTQGNQVYVAPGQEKYLQHELGHVVQQKEGRVIPTVNVNGFAVNDNVSLEREADNYEIVQQKRVLAANQDVMKRRFENHSEFSFDDVRTHYNSDKPAQFQALVHTQGNQVYIKSKQEKHLGCEVGYVIQQEAEAVKTMRKSIEIPTSEKAPVQRGKGKGKRSKSSGATVRIMESAAESSVISPLFLDQHIGDKVKAIGIAKKRAGTVLYSHTIDMGSVSRLIGEIAERNKQGFHIEDNRVPLPGGGADQFLSDNIYELWETSYDKKNRAKEPRPIMARIYYDVVANRIHHFAGIEQ